MGKTDGTYKLDWKQEY